MAKKLAGIYREKGFSLHLCNKIQCVLYGVKARFDDLCGNYGG